MFRSFRFDRLTRQKKNVRLSRISDTMRKTEALERMPGQTSAALTGPIKAEM